MRAAGKEPPEEFDTESLRARMTPAQQDRFDEAMKLADETLGGGVSLWQCVEAIAQEYLGEHGTEEDVEGVRGQDGAESGATSGPGPGSALLPEPPQMPLPEAILEHLAVIEEAEALIKEERPPQTSDPKALHAFLLRLLKARKEHDRVVGSLGLRVVDARAWRLLGYETLKEYCTERLGMTPRLFRQRVWLERQMFALPPLREALESGTLTYSKALLVAGDATPETVGDRIACAAATTWQQTAREATEREDRRNRAAGIRRLWGPVDAMLTVSAAIRCARRRAREVGRGINAGEALVAIAAYFLKIWPAHRLRKMSRSRADVLNRNAGKCQVPGCSLPARHIHHIRYRSRGGTNDPWNEVALCVAHHLHGVHEGRLLVTGRAGERLVWQFGDGEIWVTLGDNDVRRADAEEISEPAPPAYGSTSRAPTLDPGPRPAPKKEVPLPAAA